MTGTSAGDDRPQKGTNTSKKSFAQALASAYRETRLHSPQAVPEVEERLRDKLETRGVTVTPEILRALAFAIVNDRGA
ncbi:MAG: hypothetical protein M3Y77_00530 [Actinomycetota bacterium]|nr:hypothetical protein [Actinomycetota bacterium]